MKKSMAMVLLSISITVFGLYPVQAEGSGYSNVSGMTPFTDNAVESGGNAADSGSDAAGIESKVGADSGDVETGTEDAVSTDAGADTEGSSETNAIAGSQEVGSREDGGTVSGGDNAIGADFSGADVNGDSQEAGNREDGGTVSGGDNAIDAEDSSWTDASGGSQEAGSEEDGGTVSEGDAVADAESSSWTDASGERQEGGNADVDVDVEADADTAGTGEETGEGTGEGNADGISPYDLTVYPDNRLVQWNMGNSSGKYGESFDTYAVFDDNVIAALYGLGNDTYRLEFTGAGEMAGVGNYNYQPYKAYRDRIVSVTVGEGITNVGNAVFARFSKLQEYTLPASVKTIGESAFEYCTSLQAVVIPDTVDSLSDCCFQHCEAATSLTIPGDLDYNGLRIPFYNMKKLKDIYITPGKTGAASVTQVGRPMSSPANISDGYTIHFMEGVTEIHDKVFANTKASRIEIADSVTVIGADAFAKKAYDTSTVADYIVLGDNTRRIASNAFMASVQTITPTTVEIGNIYQFEYDWTAVQREVAFRVRLNALKELVGMVERDIELNLLSHNRYPAADWEELQNEFAVAKGLVEEGSSDLNRITGNFMRLYDLYHAEYTTDFIISIPASIHMYEDMENNLIKATIPVTVKFLYPENVREYTLYTDTSTFFMRDEQSGRQLELVECRDLYEFEEIEDGFRYVLGLAGERLAGDWKGKVRFVFNHP